MKTENRNELTLEQWLDGNQLSIDLWKKKYALEGETLSEWFKRVSGGNQKLESLIRAKKFIPAGRILSNRGRHAIEPEFKGTYSNCNVAIPPEDNLESIFDTLGSIARTYSYGGGVGVDLSNLAPRGAKVRNAAKSSSGAVSFMDLFSETTGLISQNGRRGAMMISMSCNHPDIEEFVDIKKDLTRVQNANISVRMTDEFMIQAKKDIETGNHEPSYTLSFTRPETNETITKQINAGDLLTKIAQNNWSMGEPGVLFWDTVEHENMLSEDPDFIYGGVNPCGEEPLPSGGSCLLGSVNLAEYADTYNRDFDYDALYRDMSIIIPAMNDVLDEGIPLHALESQRACAKRWRPIGIGIMGLADMLCKLSMRYGSNESLILCNRIARCMIDSAILYSSECAEKNGRSFDGYDYETIQKSEFYKRNVATSTDLFVRKNGLYNSQLLAIAPTGSISNLFGVSGGIEPFFAIKYTRKTQSIHEGDYYYEVYTPTVQKYMDAHGIKEDDLPSYFVTAMDIDPYERICMQAAWQTCVDASISSTINLPNSATPEDIRDLILYAWNSGLKGITFFRDGCDRAPVLSTSDKESEKAVCESCEPTLARGEIVHPGNAVIGKKRDLRTGCGTLHLCAFFDSKTGDLLETYFNKGSEGGCNSYMVGLSRMISYAARGGCKTDGIIDQLHSTPWCKSYDTRRKTRDDVSDGKCCPDAAAIALREMWEEVKQEIGVKEPMVSEPVYNARESVETGSIHHRDKQSIPKEEAVVHAQIECDISSGLCPECGAAIRYTGGCWVCPNCAASGCE